MKNSNSLEKLHEVELEILQRFVLLCEQNDIRYFIIGGTLIGAVRHRGFIPWDDDIDIAVPRKDYVRLIDVMHSIDDEVLGMEYYKDDSDLYFYPIRITNKKYRIKDPRAKEEYAHPWMDVLPIDGLPDDNLPRTIFKIKMIGYRALLGLHYVENLRDIDRGRIQRAVIAIGKTTHIGKFVDPTRVKESIDKTLSANDMKDCKMSGTCMGAYFFHEFVNTSYFGEGKKIMFEDVEVNAPAQIHPYLTHMYGDYMKLPPEEKRSHQHGVILYAEEDSMI